MALDIDSNSNGDRMYYQCPNEECGLGYDGYNCQNCSYKNESGYPGELLDNGDDVLYGDLSCVISGIVKKSLNKQGLKEGTLAVELSDPWIPQVVYIDYNISTLDNMRELANELPGITTIKYEVRDGTADFLIEMLDNCGINIDDQIRKAYYGEE